MKTYILYLKNGEGKYEPTFIGSYPPTYSQVDELINQGLNFNTYDGEYYYDGFFPDPTPIFNLGYHRSPDWSFRRSSGVRASSEKMLVPWL